MLIIVLGTRPEIIKLFPIIEVFLKKKYPLKSFIRVSTTQVN